MKKIVYTALPMQDIVNGYPAYLKGNGEFVYFPITVKLNENLREGDELTIYVFRFTDKENRRDIPEELDREYQQFSKLMSQLKTEVQEVADNLDVTVNFEVFDTAFEETRDVFGGRFFDIFDTLSENVSIIADVTFGTKPFSLMLCTALTFAEKFYNANIDSIIYGKAPMKYSEEIKRTIAYNGHLCDVTALYDFTGLVNIMKPSEPERAKHALKKFFGVE